MQQYYQVPDLKNSDIRRLARRSLRGKWAKALIPMLIITVALLLPPLVQYQELISSGILDVTDVNDLQSVVMQAGERQTGFLYSALSFFSFLCTGAFSLAAAALSVRILRKESFSPKTAFTGFRQFIQAFLVDFLVSVFSVLWSLITILPGTMIFVFCSRSTVMSFIGFLVFIAAVIAYVFLILRYSMAFFIAQDNRMLPSLHAIRYSVTLMKDRVAKYFSLQFSFIGWIVLAVIPMSAGMMFMNAFSQTGSGMMRFVAVCLILIGFVTVAMVQLYVNTADAVFYSAVSGNFGIADHPSADEKTETVSGAELQQIPSTDETAEAALSGIKEQDASASDTKEDIRDTAEKASETED